MGSASLIATAVALVLLIFTAYVVVGGILATADIVTMSQNEKYSLQENRMRTSIDISGITVSNETNSLEIVVNNCGNEKISKFMYMDIYMINQGAQPKLIPYTETPAIENTWTVSQINPDSVHPNELDPGESATMTVTYSAGVTPLWVKVTTPNGVYDSAYINL